MVLRSMLVGLVVVSSLGCQADFHGDAYEPVAKASEIEIHNKLPPGYRIIGEVVAFDEKTVNGNSLVGRLRCPTVTKMHRRMKRTAADVGGELLIDVVCDEVWEEEEQAPAGNDCSVFEDCDPDEEWTDLYCMVDCTAYVARGLEHDD